MHVLLQTTKATLLLQLQWEMFISGKAHIEGYSRYMPHVRNQTRCSYQHAWH